MKPKNNEFLLFWNDRLGRFDKHILNLACQQNVKGEVHYVLGMRVN